MSVADLGLNAADPLGTNPVPLGQLLRRHDLRVGSREYQCFAAAIEPAHQIGRRGVCTVNLEHCLLYTSDAADE